LTASWVFFSFLEEEDGGLSQSRAIASTAGNLRLAVGIFTNQLAFRFGAFGLGAFPVTSWFFTDSFAFRFGRLWFTNIDEDTWQWVTQWGCLQIVTHFGQSSASQALSGHLIFKLAARDMF